ncbi:MAG: DNA primase, partial [Longimicrobiales bacterium]
MIGDALIEEVRARADIVELIGEQIPLKRAGKEFKALCPFHNEKTPSFYVVPAKGFYKCFGCGESGDVFTFLMKRGGLGFLDAVRQVATRVGVEIPDAGPERREDEPNRALYEVVAFAADHFQHELWDEPGGERARRYLEHRDIARDAAERFQLGFAPDEWRRLREAAHRHGIEDVILLAAGLIKEPDRGDEPYDRFRDRIIFPIAEVSGRTVAFGGRALSRSDGAPKYLNSPETPVYHKGAILYGLNWSKTAIRREGSALVVEGYMDYVSLAARGAEHVVAGMGTALTPEQANLIGRYTARAYLLYDSDVAGLRATFRTADALLRAGVHPLVVSLPEGEDPDSLVRKGGAAALASHVETAQDVLERKLGMLEERGFFGGIEGSRRALDRLLPTLRAVIDPALRDIYVGRVAERTGVRRETLEAEMAVDAPSFGSAAAARSARARFGARGRDRSGASRDRDARAGQRAAEG